MHDKVQNGEVPRQSVSDALPTVEQLQLNATIRKLQVARKWLDDAIALLENPNTPGAQLPRVSYVARRAFLGISGFNDLCLFAQMQFLTILSGAAFDVQRGRKSVDQAADDMFYALAFDIWGDVWGALWLARRDSGALQSLTDAVSVWLRGRQWHKGEGDPILDLLRSAGLATAKTSLKQLKSRWTGKTWRQGPMRTILAQLPPYVGGRLPKGAATAPRSKKPGPKSQKVIVAADEYNRLLGRVDPDEHIEKLADGLKAEKPEASRAGFVQALKRAERRNS